MHNAQNGGKYLFIRILEACNAACFAMCGFAMSRDVYRFGVTELKAMLPRLREEGVGTIRFTGGEPLIHQQVTALVQAITDHGLRSSIITNGALLKKRVPALADAGLGQVIVSIDAVGETHDQMRGIKGLFGRCVSGIEAAKECGIFVRVNSVVGPHNYGDMPALQDVFTALSVRQWEMSSLKLNKGPLGYTDADRKAIEQDVIPTIFERGLSQGKLVPFGKIWCGDTPVERDRYFNEGIPPRADGVCHVVDYVRYLDARNGKLYACSLIPHRVESEKVYPAFARLGGDFSTCAADIEAQADYFRANGSTVCTGCSTTAAGFSNRIREGMKLNDWAY